MELNDLSGSRNCYADESKVKLFVSVVQDLVSEMCRKSIRSMGDERSRSLLLRKEVNELRLK